jgi:hypothetical protein
MGGTGDAAGGTAALNERPVARRGSGLFRSGGRRWRVCVCVCVCVSVLNFCFFYTRFAKPLIPLSLAVISQWTAGGQRSLLSSLEAELA